MTAFMLLLGVFVGGAIPWLEAIVVIPGGIIGGLHPVAAVAAGASGNLITVWIAAYAGNRVRTWWQNRRDRKRTRPNAAPEAANSTADDHTSNIEASDVDAGPINGSDSDVAHVEVARVDLNGAAIAEDADMPKKGGRARRILERWGLPALAIAGPLGLGTQVSAMVAVGFGISPARSFRWIGAATVLWSIVAAVLTVMGLDFAGVGASQ